MAVITAAATYQENNGSLTLLKFDFTSVTTAGDTFASGLGSSMAFGYWAVVTSGITASCATDKSTAITPGVNVKESGGTFTITPGANAVPVSLFVWAKI
jgi:hypothetical protein